MAKQDPVPVTLFTRQNCSLCDKAKGEILQVSRKSGIALNLSEVDIDDDPELVEKFGYDVPVVYVGGQFAFQHHVNPAVFLELLRAPGIASASAALESKHCEPCRGGMPTIDPARIPELLGQLDSGWRVVDGHHLRRELTFPDFRTALAYVNRAGEIAEQEGHHPDLTLGYGRVAIDLWTHAAGGLTENDFILAAKLDRAVS